LIEYINPEIAEKHNDNARELFKQGKYPDALREYDVISNPLYLTKK
jgi:hypothetical protein